MTPYHLYTNWTNKPAFSASAKFSLTHIIGKALDRLAPPSVCGRVTLIDSSIVFRVVFLSLSLSSSIAKAMTSANCQMVPSFGRQASGPGGSYPVLTLAAPSRFSRSTITRMPTSLAASTTVWVHLPSLLRLLYVGILLPANLKPFI